MYVYAHIRKMLNNVYTVRIRLVFRAQSKKCLRRRLVFRSERENCLWIPLVSAAENEK